MMQCPRVQYVITLATYELIYTTRMFPFFAQQKK